jgi:hypothetical protein
MCGLEVNASGGKSWAISGGVISNQWVSHQTGQV